jgi:hypothetical protein
MKLAQLFLRIRKSMTTLIKNTNNDKRELLSKALRNHFRDDSTISWVYLVDFDDNFIYFAGEDRDYRSEDYKLSYSITDVTSVSFSGEPQRVERLTEYKDVPEESKVSKSLTDSLGEALDKYFGCSKKETLSVIKQFNDEEMIAVEALYILPESVDGQGDTISLDETYNLVKSFNEANEDGTLQSSLFHGHKSQSFKVNKAWVNPYQCMIGETLVEEGQPLCEIQFTNPKAWELRKSGKLMGLSIGAMATEVEEL